VVQAMCNLNFFFFGGGALAAHFSDEKSFRVSYYGPGLMH